MNPRRLRQLADGLTLMRAVIALPLLLALSAQQPVIAWLLLLGGSLSDWLDGSLARRAGGGSVWGARLDPLTDKILVSAPLLWLAQQQILPLWAVWLLLARELLISGWRAGQTSGGPASSSGKAKTVLQCLSLLLMLWPASWLASAFLQRLGWWLFWPSLALALSSAIHYLAAGMGPAKSE
jgi:CDP-diacylglycerol--glycerol-3-phosphate 3-phosphatidyltransferase